MPLKTDAAGQPAAQPTAQPIEGEKKFKWWLWVIIALVVIGAAVAVYFLFF